MVLIAMMIFVSLFAALAVHTIFKARQMKSNYDQTKSLMNISERKTEIDVLKIFDDMKNKAQEINPALLEQIESYNSNTVGLQSLHEYQFILAESQTPIAVSSNKSQA